jgi:hypothetical protein
MTDPFGPVVTPHLSDNLDRWQELPASSDSIAVARRGTAFTVNRPGTTCRSITLPLLQPGHVLVIDGGGATQ